MHCSTGLARRKYAIISSLLIKPSLQRERGERETEMKRETDMKNEKQIGSE